MWAVCVVSKNIQHTVVYLHTISAYRCKYKSPIFKHLKTNFESFLKYMDVSMAAKAPEYHHSN